MSSQSLGNIEDVEKFVRMILASDRNRLTGLRALCGDDEVVAEGVALLFELYPKWDPDRCALFSSFAMTFLPMRLIEWYRKELRQTCRGSYSGRRGAYTMFDVQPMEDQQLSLTSYGPGE